MDLPRRSRGGVDSEALQGLEEAGARVTAKWFSAASTRPTAFAKAPEYLNNMENNSANIVFFPIEKYKRVNML
jgi:hypothetical protein